MKYLEPRLAKARKELESMDAVDCAPQPRTALLRTALFALQSSIATRPGPDSPAMDSEAHAYLYLSRYLDRRSGDLA